jgi:hypothetical protein
MGILIKRDYKPLVVLGFMALLLAGSPPYLQAEASKREYAIKAAVLFNVAKFVYWPEISWPSPGDSVQLCIVGLDPFAKVMKKVLRNKKIRQRPITIMSLVNTENIQKCHILFLGSEKYTRKMPIIEQTKNVSILTIGEGPNFIKQGGMIRFFNHNNKLRFEINLPVTKKAQLRISTKLLRLAKVVGSEAK